MQGSYETLPPTFIHLPTLNVLSLVSDKDIKTIMYLNLFVVFLMKV